MDCFRIQGGEKLAGKVLAAGSKNAALPMLAASLLMDDPVRLSRLPALEDIRTMRALLSDLGASVESNNDASEWQISCPPEGPTEAPYEIVRRMRASVAVLGPLLARRGRAKVSLPGGCVIGVRPIDLHLKGLAALGAKIHVKHGEVVAEAPADGLRGGQVYLASRWGSTVLGTANVMMAATLAKGRTTIDGAAQEPEIVVLAEFLNSCGARVAGAGSPQIRIDGVERLGGGSGRIPADRIETGTLLLAAAATCGDVEVGDCQPSELAVLLDMFQSCGVPFRQGEDWLRVMPWTQRPRALDICCRPYPGFPTDLQAQWMAFSTVAEGLAMVSDSVYPDRFMHVAELNRLGAHIRREGGSAWILGPAQLSGAPVLASDLRASAALVIGGLAASGETIVRRVYHLDRGYQQLERKLSDLGAKVRREVDEEPV
jgi:UDP-N-acetylglucosamine 1-carboxyvinyltransferase